MFEQFGKARQEDSDPVFAALPAVANLTVIEQAIRGEYPGRNTEVACPSQLRHLVEGKNCQLIRASSPAEAAQMCGNGKKRVGVCLTTERDARAYGLTILVRIGGQNV